MTAQYQFSSASWVMLAAAAFVAAVALYALRQRSVPGALAFALTGLFGAASIAGLALATAAADASGQIFWIKFSGLWLPPSRITWFLFALTYANLTRRAPPLIVIALCLPLLLHGALLVTNDPNHWMWAGFEGAGQLRPIRGPANWFLVTYGYALGLASLFILARLFVRSPLHRRPVALIFAGELLTLIGFGLNISPLSATWPASVARLTLAALPAAAASALYGYALFHYRMFDPVPLARATVLKQMREGMIVLDSRAKIAGLNRAAEEVFSRSFAELRGRDPADVLPGWSAAALPLKGEEASARLTLGQGTAARHFDLRAAPLRDGGGAMLGALILLHDVTEQERAQAQVIRQQAALATFTERERLARELHDSLGQVLSYLRMQVATIRKQMADGQLAAADEQLCRAENALAEAHADVREHILGLRASAAPQQSFFAALQRYIDGYSLNYGIGVTLNVASDLDETALRPDTQAQVFRIIQEALTNARKHARARCAAVTFERGGTTIRVAIEDDGQGFDLAAGTAQDCGHFGLQFMAERAAQLGGALRVDSTPGQGTRVEIRIPAR